MCFLRLHDSTTLLLQILPRAPLWPKKGGLNNINQEWGRILTDRLLAAPMYAPLDQSVPRKRETTRGAPKPSHVCLSCLKEAALNKRAASHMRAHADNTQCT